MDDNPFRAPMEMQPLSMPSATGQFQRDNTQLIVSSGVVLPPFCVKTGEPVSEEGMVTKTITWTPLWVLVIFFLSPLIGLIVYFVVRKKCEITYGLTREIKSKIKTRQLISFFVALGCFAGIFLAVKMENGVIGLVSLVLLLIALVVMLVSNSQLSAANHVNGRFWIRGFSREFLAQIE